MSSQSVRIASIVACFVIAGAPPLGFTYYLEEHAAETARHDMTGYADRMIRHANRVIDEAREALSNLEEVPVTRCERGTRERMRDQLFASHLLREIAVVSGDGRTLCGSSYTLNDQWKIDEPLDLSTSPGIAVAPSMDSFASSLALILPVGDDRALVGFIAPEGLGLDILPDDWRTDGSARLRLDNGAQILSVPGLPTFSAASRDDAIRVQEVSTRYPIEAEIVVARAAVMEPYAVLKAYTLLVMSVFGGIMVIVALSIAWRRPSAGDDIAAGMRRGEFIPFYQPVINITTGQLEGCEVLMRRRRRDGRIEVPADFIVQAEADGQIVPMTRQLMRQAIADLGETYSANEGLSVAFNLCAQHFRDDGVVRDVQEIFSGSTIRMDQLVLEVTERFPLADMSKAKSIIGKLQALGAKVALDDAGTGHSGLAALHHLGMDIVKIDKIFIDSIGDRTTSAPIVDTLVELAKSLGMEIVAEGVETLAQVRYLKAKGVDTAQGYLFAPPLPASSYCALVKTIAGPRPAAGTAARRAVA